MTDKAGDISIEEFQNVLEVMIANFMEQDEADIGELTGLLFGVGSALLSSAPHDFKVHAIKQLMMLAGVEISDLHEIENLVH